MGAINIKIVVIALVVGVVVGAGGAVIVKNGQNAGIRARLVAANAEVATLQARVTALQEHKPGDAQAKKFNSLDSLGPNGQSWNGGYK